MTIPVFGCPGCQKKEHLEIGQYRSPLPLLSGNRLVICRNYQLVRVMHLPNPADMFKINIDFWHIQGFDIRNYIMHSAQMRSRIQYIEHNIGSINGMKILDVGSGFGILSNTLKLLRYSFEYHAIEMDKSCRKVLTKKGASSVSEDPKGCPATDFDLVVCSHVIEHIPHPVLFLQDLTKMLRPGGYLFIEVPNQGYLFKSDYGTHLLFFSPQSLRSLLSNLAGLSLYDLTTVGSSLNILVEKREMESKKLPDEGILPRLLMYTKMRLPTPVKRSALWLLYSCKTFLGLRSELNSDKNLYKYGDNRQWIRCILERMH